ncbi:hypothetical protein [Peteryoungia algae]|uniref:Uncharacterized protein n=1 Tax=Peteryoungia algae TaxID=2919917 RepID=A0ABT0CXE3_9HYPH|nr:hypothetical protein [Rhizobium sp. SSM4.3]MCJ8237823.1 hypothetical protein [Rhizobium sp. SSM4.3]
MVMTQEQMEERRRQVAVFDGDVDRARSGYHVGEGWHAILDDLVREFAKIDDLGFLSAHEKWGGLRVSYLYPGDRSDDVEAIVKRASHRAQETCWYCGQPGKLKQERWWRVRCDEHWSPK